MYEREILEALQKAVTAAVAASDTPTLPVSYVDTNFTVPQDRKYLEIVYIPNNSGGDFLSDQKNYQGIMRIVLHWPKGGGGAYSPLDALASISAYFTKGRLISGVQIVETPNLTGLVPQDDEVLYPASIRYQSYRA